MTLTVEEKEEAVKALITVISGNTTEMNRNEIINAAMAALGYTEEHKENGSADSRYNNVHSVMGACFTDLLSRGKIVKSGKTYKLKESKTVSVNKKICRDKLLSLLGKAPHTQSSIASQLIKQFEADKTATLKDDNLIKTYIGQILSELLKENTVVFENNKYKLVEEGERKSYPTTPLPEEEFEKAFLSRLCDNGGPFFEFFVANLLEKYYLITGRKVLACDVSGGSEDGCVDVIVDTLEELGFTEHIMVQAKCRRNIQVTEKEVRQFYGGMVAQNGTRGIYITTSVFHKAAWELIYSIDNCVGVDGHKVFLLAKKTSYGMKHTKNGYVFDNSIFRI